MKPIMKRPSNNRGAKFSRSHTNRSHPQGRSSAAQRNNLQQTFEKYMALAREASSTGDRILAENYYQFAEHYLRTLNEMKPIEVEIPKEEALNSSEDNEVVCDEPAPLVSAAPLKRAQRKEEKKEEQPLHS